MSEQNVPQDEEKAIEAARRAGWNPEDGPPPHEHGGFVEGIETTDAPPQVQP